ncbi:RNA-binding domain-containing protein [Rozella allomycis CSF55]|uniref:RNA recognition motif domain-containing protein n=1 Tax=Rozella allomycis (strain CSF55) TaxID=988480 RepID=A0A075AW66_ROZAC|nr:RNA recognition motif domain-containing protein [Rozella allomycis CSF55]RKP21823.1 RNA-binding domain-containing protein [Rozella allomycis CSF55]|eukprot:EPZ34548.1 RNA recognition motif domain-containing protein [Rozella allomycis CSF55]
MQRANTAQPDKNQEANVYIGNIDEKVSEALLWELMLQAGQVVNVFIPRDRVTGLHQGFGFCEFATVEDADYACKIMNMVKLYGKPIRLNKAAADKKELDIGATLFIGNLAPEVDEKTLYDTFSAFGVILQTPKIVRDATSGVSRGVGFVHFDNFESSDQAISAMNGQYLSGKAITVSYANKKDGKGGQHGTAAERLLASQAKRRQVNLGNELLEMQREQMAQAAIATQGQATFAPPTVYVPPGMAFPGRAI